MLMMVNFPELVKLPKFQIPRKETEMMIQKYIMKIDLPI